MERAWERSCAFKGVARRARTAPKRSRVGMTHLKEDESAHSAGRGAECQAAEERLRDVWHHLTFVENRASGPIGRARTPVPPSLEPPVVPDDQDNDFNHESENQEA